MDLPTIDGANMQTILLLGAWLFVAVQSNKGRVWPDSWTGALVMALPILLAPIAVWGSPQVNAYAQAMAVMYLIGVGFWAVTKATRPPD